MVSMMLKSFGEGRLKAIRRIKVTSRMSLAMSLGYLKTCLKTLSRSAHRGNLSPGARDQSWLNSNMARVTELEGINSLEEVGQRFISEFTPILGAHYGAIYIRQEDKHPNKLEMKGSYAHEGGEEPKISFMIGEGLVGQRSTRNRSY